MEKGKLSILLMVADALIKYRKPASITKTGDVCKYHKLRTFCSEKTLHIYLINFISNH